MGNNNTNIGDVVGGGFFGLLIGAIGMVGLGLAIGPNVEKTKTFAEENRPSVVRVYVHGSDRILVENPALKGEHMPLYQHLNSIEDIAERALEEARIKKQVEWYK